MENLDPVQHLVEVVRRLRGPGGCPWDREQTHASLRGDLLEEAYEVVDAINRKDDANLKEELGDLLLQSVFHSQIAEDEKRFTFQEVAESICEKLIRRHPHVFGDATAENSEQVLVQWDAIKRGERDPEESVLGEIPAALPSLMRAEKVQKRAARVGFDWPKSADVLEKVREEIGEIETEIAAGDAAKTGEEIGDLLFSIVNLARHLKVEPEVALQAATDKFIRRFHGMEKAAKLRGEKMDGMSLDQLEELWTTAKRESA